MNMNKKNELAVAMKKVAETAPEEKSEFIPDYTEEQVEHLKAVTDMAIMEIQRVAMDPRYHTVPYANEQNCLVNLKEAYKDGIQFGTPLVNRTHGKDQETTCHSIREYGAQHILIVVTPLMAETNDIRIARFSNDSLKDEPLPSEALILIDGNGRVNALLSLPVDEWPDIYAVFPTKDAAGFYNFRKIIEVINTQVSVWKTQDMVQKRLLDEGDAAHEGWMFINQLVKKGYKYQAACQTATMGSDRIQKKLVNTGDSNYIFTHFESAKEIHLALVEKFGEGDDKVLKTKEFTREVSILWGQLQRQSGDEIATKTFVDFIDNIPNEKVLAIINAKSIKTETSRKPKDEIRKEILDKLFYEYCKIQNINI